MLYTVYQGTIMSDWNRHKYKLYIVFQERQVILSQYYWKSETTILRQETCKKRNTLKSAGHCLVDDVIKLNTEIITELNEHSSIQTAWLLNGSVYGKATEGKRLRFDLNDNIDSVVAKSSKKLKGVMKHWHWSDLIWKVRYNVIWV